MLIPYWEVNVNGVSRPDAEQKECLVRLFKVGAVLECSLHYDAEALMVLYGFIAGRGALSAAREDYFKAFCWLWNVKCLDHPHSEFQGCLGVPLFKDGKMKIVCEKESEREREKKKYCSV